MCQEVVSHCSTARNEHQLHQRVRLLWSDKPAGSSRQCGVGLSVNNTLGIELQGLHTVSDNALRKCLCMKQYHAIIIFVHAPTLMPHPKDNDDILCGLSTNIINNQTINYKYNNKTYIACWLTCLIESP